MSKLSTKTINVITGVTTFVMITITVILVQPSGHEARGLIEGPILWLICRFTIWKYMQRQARLGEERERQSDARWVRILLAVITVVVITYIGIDAFNQQQWHDPKVVEAKLDAITEKAKADIAVVDKNDPQLKAKLDAIVHKATVDMAAVRIRAGIWKVKDGDVVDAKTGECVQKK
jgi:hypothetical protein